MLSDHFNTPAGSDDEQDRDRLEKDRILGRLSDVSARLEGALEALGDFLFDAGVNVPARLEDRSGGGNEHH